MSFLLIDGNSLGFAAQNASRLTANGQPVHAIYHTLKMIKKAIQSNPGYKHPLVLWDGKAQFRLDLFPEYKGKRKANPKMEAQREEYHLQRPEIIKALEYLGVAQVNPSLFEADDLAGFMVRKATKATQKTLLVSGDRDWLQLANALTSWYDPRSNGTDIIGKSELKEFSGFATPRQFLEAKAILGDSSDCIDGIPGLGEKACVAIMEEYGSVVAMIKDQRANGPFAKRKDIPKSLSRFRKKLDDFAGSKELIQHYQRNMKLMDLLDDSRDEAIRQDCVVTRMPRDMDQFADFCGHHKFASILRELNTWKF